MTDFHDEDGQDSVVDLIDEDSLLDYALRVTASQLEERCREIRNSTPESVGAAWKAWEHRSLVVSRDPLRGMLRITVEMPVEDGEVVVKAIERVAESTDEATGIEFASAGGLAGDGVREAGTAREASANGWRPGGLGAARLTSTRAERAAPVKVASVTTGRSPSRSDRLDG